MGMFTVPKEDIDRCVQRLRDIDTGSNSEQVLREIQPTILSMGNGKTVFAMVEKLVRAGNSARAIKLIKVAPKRRAGIFRIGTFLGPIAIGALLLLGMPMMTRCNGAYEPAMAALNACPQAAALLGVPISQAPVGLACGSSETSGAYGHANWQFTVRGPNGSGKFQFAGRNNGQGWQLDTALLTVGDQTVSVWPCSKGAALPGSGTAPLTGATTLTGTVISAQGTTLPVNTPCSITVSPTPPQAVQNGYNCHVRVQCGAWTIYGWEGAGYTRCQVAGGVASRADDTTGAAQGDDPMLALDTVGRTCQVSDNSTQPYTVNISLTPLSPEAPTI